MSNYSELLKDPRWQKKRLKIFERDEWKCAECSSDKHTLHVHHKRYISGNKPWDYDDTDLITMCEGCHEMEESMKEYTLFHDHAQASSITMMHLWKLSGAYCYCSMNNSDVFDKVRDLLNNATFLMPPGEERLKFIQFLTNPLGKDRNG